MAVTDKDDEEVVLAVDDTAQSWLVYKYGLKIPRIPETHTTKVNKKKEEEKKENKPASGLQTRKRGKKGRK